MKTNVLKAGKSIGNVLIALIAFIGLIGLCPITPFIWLLIHASTLIWIWLAVSIVLTLFLVWCLAEASSWQDHDEIE